MVKAQTAELPDAPLYLFTQTRYHYFTQYIHAAVTLFMKREPQLLTAEQLLSGRLDDRHIKTVFCGSVK